MNPADKIAFLKSLSKAAITNNEIETPSIKELPTLDTVEPKIQPKRESYVSSVLESTAGSIEQSLRVDAEKLEKMTSTVLEASMLADGLAEWDIEPPISFVKRRG